MNLRRRIGHGWSMGQTAPNMCAVLIAFVGMALGFGVLAALLSSCGALMIR